MKIANFLYNITYILCMYVSTGKLKLKNRNENEGISNVLYPCRFFYHPIVTNILNIMSNFDRH